MYRMRHIFIVWLGLSFMFTGCLPEPEPAIDEATVLRDNTSLRIGASSASRTMYTLYEGDRVSILEKRGTWYRVRDSNQIEGWMDESTILGDLTMAAMRLGVSEASRLPIQNTARAREEVNLRLAPGRDTDVIRRLPRQTTLEVLERSTTRRPDSNATDVWFKVRPLENEIGWVYSGLIEFDTPEPLLPFMEGRTYVAVQKLRQVEDPVVGLIDWYVVAERRSDTETGITYDGIRVFVWNLEEHQYETTLRLRNLNGAYPLERTGEADNPGFRFHVARPDGDTIARYFVMRQTLPREARE
jgi:SH3-like domain-containing protein